MKVMSTFDSKKNVRILFQVINGSWTPHSDRGSPDDGFINKGIEMVNLDTRSESSSSLGGCRVYRADWR